MTRLKYYLPLVLLSLALALALTAGSGLSAMQRFSTELTGAVFAAPYQIQARDSLTAPVPAAVVNARVSNGTVLVSAHETGLAPASFALDQVNLSAASPKALAENNLRAGLFSLALLLSALLCSAVLAVSGLALLEKNRRATALRRQKRQHAAALMPRSVPPTSPDRFPHAA